VNVTVAGVASADWETDNQLLGLGTETVNIVGESALTETMLGGGSACWLWKETLVLEMLSGAAGNE
jgi:hypothetical protein